MLFSLVPYAQVLVIVPGWRGDLILQIFVEHLLMSGNVLRSRKIEKNRHECCPEPARIYWRERHRQGITIRLVSDVNQVLQEPQQLVAKVCQSIIEASQRHLLLGGSSGTMKACQMEGAGSHDESLESLAGWQGTVGVGLELGGTGEGWRCRRVRRKVPNGLLGIKT